VTRAANDRTPIFVLSRVFWYGVMPLSGALMIAYTVRDLWGSWLRAHPATKEEGH